MRPESATGEVAELAEGAPLLREYTATPYRGFESHPLRQGFDKSYDQYRRLYKDAALLVVTNIIN